MFLKVFAHYYSSHIIQNYIKVGERLYPAGAQKWLLALCTVVTPGVAQGTKHYAWDQTRVAHNVSALIFVLSPWSLSLFWKTALAFTPVILWLHNDPWGSRVSRPSSWDSWGVAAVTTPLPRYLQPPCFHWGASKLNPHFPNPPCRKLSINNQWTLSTD